MARVVCERCGRTVRKGKRFCKDCAVDVARRWNLDYFDPEEDTQIIEDPVFAYERSNKVKAAIALAIVAIIGTLAMVAIVGGW